MIKTLCNIMAHAHTTGAPRTPSLSLVWTLPPNSGDLLLQQLDQGTAERDLLSYSLCHGEEAAPSHSQDFSGQNRCITPEDGDGDPEFPQCQQRMHARAAHRLWAC